MLKKYFVFLFIITIPCFAQVDPDAKSSKIKVTLKYDSLKSIAGNSEMILIKGGNFDGKEINSFKMDKTLITVEQYMACVEAGVCPPPPKNDYWSDTYKKGKSKLPVNNISWFNANTFAAWVGKRLPTDAEWEWAARGREEARIYPWGNEAPTKSSACWMRYNSSDDTGEGTCEVGNNAFSRDGVADMAGLLWEWTSTFANDDKTLVILKGGAWYNDDPEKLKVTYRGHATPYHRGASSDGFRLVKNIN